MALNLAGIYRDLHANPEHSFQEHRTAGIGPTVLLRADMDALPVLEATGPSYASSARGTDPDGNDVPVMHACGHDVHVTCLLGATERLVDERDDWSGTLVVPFQPAEEWGGGAESMIADGLYDRVPRPGVVLGRHVAPFPAGLAAVRAGVTIGGGRLAHRADPRLRRTRLTLRDDGGPRVPRSLDHGPIAGHRRPGARCDGFELQGSPSSSPRSLTVNDEAATERTTAALRAALGADHVIDPGSSRPIACPTTSRRTTRPPSRPSSSRPSASE
jgi:hypothetical protein